MISAIVPFAIVLIVLVSLFRRVGVFDAFVEGAADALPLLGKILPSLAAMLVAVSVFRDSGALDFGIRLLAPVTTRIGVDAELLPLILLRPLSGSAAIAIANDLMTAHGADSFLGFTASVLVGASETVFYTVALYFGAVSVKKTRWTLPAALLCTLVAAVTGILFSRLFY